MSNDDHPIVNPYAPTATLAGPYEASSHRSYGGIGRLAYVGCTFAAGFVYNMAMLPIGAAGSEAAAMIALPLMLVYLGVLLWIIALRMINTGYSPWWCVGMLIPFLNILVGVRCIACPEGYADHRELDTAGKVVVGLFLGMFVFVVGAIFVSVLS